MEVSKYLPKYVYHRTLKENFNMNTSKQKTHLASLIIVSVFATITAGSAIAVNDAPLT